MKEPERDELSKDSEGKHDKGLIYPGMITPEWLLNQIALKALLEKGDFEYAKRFAEAARVAVNANGATFSNQEDLVMKIKTELDKTLLERVIEKKLQTQKGYDELERERQDLIITQEAFLKEIEGFDKDRNAKKAQLESEEQKLQERKLWIETQKTELAKERERLEKQREKQAVTEREIEAKRQSQEDQARQPITINQKTQDQEIMRECEEKLRLELNEQKLLRDRQKFEKSKKTLESQKSDITEGKKGLRVELTAVGKLEDELRLVDVRRTELAKEKERLQEVRNDVIRHTQLAEINHLLNESRIALSETSDAVRAFNFFKQVCRGNLQGVYHYLKVNKAFALAKGDLKDLSGRVFKQITALQYAFWALDVEMCHLILTHLPYDEVIRQIVEFKQQRTDITGAYGVHFSLQEYQCALRKFLDNADAWGQSLNDFGKEAMARCWCVEIGGAQRSFPAWMIMLMSEPGEDVAWVKQNLRLGFKRDDKLLDAWFVQDGAHQLGAKPNMLKWWSDPSCGFAWARGQGLLLRWQANRAIGEWASCAHIDYEFSTIIEKERLEAVESLDSVDAIPIDVMASMWGQGN